jgi:hypothetical protein
MWSGACAYPVASSGCWVMRSLNGFAWLLTHSNWSSFVPARSMSAACIQLVSLREGFCADASNSGEEWDSFMVVGLLVDIFGSIPWRIDERHVVFYRLYKLLFGDYCENVLTLSLIYDMMISSRYGIWNNLASLLNGSSVCMHCSMCLKGSSKRDGRCSSVIPARARQRPNSVVLQRRLGA